MNISAPFIHRPVATSLLMLAVIFVGTVAWLRLPIAGVPQVDIPTISIYADLPGASAETMAASVTAPLERALALMPGVTSMTSTSALGSASISVQFDLTRSIDGAALDVQTAINAASGDLPKNLPHPPTFGKANPADALLMTIAVTSDAMPIGKLDDLIENQLAPQIARIVGVGEVDYHGDRKPAIRVRIDPNAAASAGVSLEDVRATLAQSTSTTPKGTLNSAQQAIVLDANDQLSDARDYAALIVAYRNDAPVRLRDIGSVVADIENVRKGAWLAERPAIMIDVHKQIGFNINETVARIKAELPRLTAQLPPTVQLTLLQDRTQTIRTSVVDLQFTLALTVVLVVLVVYLFLRNWRATLIPACAIPLSILGTVASMDVLGYTLDNVSLMALTIVIGFVIDDAIVMLENILRHIELGLEPLAAALEGSREIGFTIVSMTASLVAVFIPLLFMGGLVGRLFREFAVTATIAIVLSGLVSLTLTPMLCARFVDRHTGHGGGRLSQLAERGFDRLHALYARGLRWVLVHRRLTLAVTLATLAGTVALYIVIPKGFFPQQDNGLISGLAEGPQDIAYPAMVERMQQVSRIVEQDPDVEHVYSWLEGSPSLNIGRLLIDLKPFGQRATSAYAVIDRLRPQLTAVPSLQVSLQARQDVQVGARISKTQFQYTLRDADLAELNEWAPRVLEALRTIPILQDVQADLQPTAPRLKAIYDRDTMARFGITPQLVDDTLYDGFGQRQVATYYTQVNAYRVVLEVDPAYQLDAGALDRVHVRAANGKLVPMAAFTRLEASTAPLTVNHDGQFPAVTLSFNLVAGHALGDAVDAVAAKMREFHAPENLVGSFQGSAQAFQASLATQPFLIFAAILAVYIVLGMLYESYLEPLTILSTLPSAGVGALASLILLGYEFSLIALIGVILLIGIVKKNGIMMVDFAIGAEREQGLDSETAIYQASLQRFRPIMMTTMAALLGALPLALGSGAGSELRRPLGIAMVGGLLFSQLLTLYTTPVIYLYLNRLKRPATRPRALASQ